MIGENQTPNQVYDEKQNMSKMGDAPAQENRGALTGSGGQTPKTVVVRASRVPYPPFVRYYLIKGFRIVDDVVLGEPIKAVEAVGMYQDQYLETDAEEGDAIIIETKWGYEYCGDVKVGARSTIYVDHMPIELENIELMPCDAREVERAYEVLNAHGLSIASMINNVWRSIVPYVPYVMTKLGIGW